MRADLAVDRTLSAEEPMAALERFGGGRTCVVVAPQGAADLVAALARAGFEPVAARDERQALGALGRSEVAAVYLSQVLGTATVRALLDVAAQRCPDAPAVILGAAGSVQEAVDAMQLGAADYLAPSFDPDGSMRRLALLLARPGRGDDAAPQRLPGIVGTSPAMLRLYDAVEKISRYKSNVLLLGESGTGKEIIARALHDRGPRRHHLFVPVNCATLGREILENELFGHERGAFTGANERKRGLFELADGGTFFLDEIAEMDVSTQAKLLRVLERNEFRRVGGTAKVQVDLSVIAATNRDLEDAIAAGRFREDLYYRLKVVTVVVPPLRERREDIPALVDAFVADFNRRMAGRIAGLSPAALRRLAELDWPGNVRELRNAVEGACVLAAGETVTLGDFERATISSPRAPVTPARAPARSSRAGRRPSMQRLAATRVSPVPGTGGGTGTVRAFPVPGTVQIPADATLADAERLVVRAALRQHGTRARAARALGIGLRTLYTKLAAWGPGVDAESA
jgi:DNA-binding NtrC family response regulator